MPDIVLHDNVALNLQRVVETPSHAVLITGTRGIGKGVIARSLAGQLADVDAQNLDSHPYVRLVRAGNEKSISIETIRELEHFLSLRVPGNGRRVIVVEDAHLLTTEAQNAFLKTLEEPPLNTIILLTTASEQALLPTIRSRVNVLNIQRPSASALTGFFKQAGYPELAIRRASLMSGGLPGLMQAMLSEDSEHPMVQAAETARQIVQKPTFERLAMVDALAKDRDYALNVLTILQQMAHVSLGGANPSKTWQHILSKSYTATEQLLQNAQAKLVLTNLMLSL